MAESRLETYGVRHCYIEYNNAGVIAFKRAWMTKECEIKVSSQKLEFSGDGQKFQRNYGYEASGTIAAQIDDDTIDQILWGLTSPTPGVGDDFTKRYYHGGDQELQTTYVGLRLSINGANTDTGAPVVIRFRILKVQFDPDTPVKYQTEAVGGRMLSWNAHKASTDIAGVTPTSIPTGGCFWMRDILTNPTNFDPVPGDIL